MLYFFLWVTLFLAILLGLKWYYWRKDLQSRPITIGFFHPYCDNGGGGERVLWQAIQALEKFPVQCVIYTGDASDSEEILSRASERFNLPKFTKPVHMVKLRKRSLVEDSKYPRFTLLGQSLGSMILAHEGLRKFIPSYFIDTTGYAFTFPVAWLFGCRVGCYVHYPTISTDMLQKVLERRPSHNNQASISNSQVLSFSKLLYYKIFAFLYGFCGQFAEVVMVNSTWTCNHVKTIWRRSPQIVYPPCDTRNLQQIPLGKPVLDETKSERKDLVISIAQFRPEKDHMLQIESFKLFIEKSKNKKVQFVLLGGVRGAEDQKRVDILQDKINEYKLQDRIRIESNVPYKKLLEYYSTALAGLHTMWNEHFGIGVVEFMAAGVIPVAHNSGGPKGDIVISYNGTQTGFLASTVEEYSEALAKIFSNEFKGSVEMQKMREAARERAQEFSDEHFQQGFLKPFSFTKSS